MEIALKTKQAYAEVDSFIEILDEKEKNKIPKKLREVFKTQKDVNYDTDILELIENNKLKSETLAIIAFLNLKYWCEDEVEKQRLIKIYNENECKYQKELMEKYNSNNIFKNNDKIKTTPQVNLQNVLKENMQTTTKELQNISQKDITQNAELTEIKENIFQKIIRKIKNIFR